MKEKEKGKVNPFIEDLRPGEEIVWFYRYGETRKDFHKVIAGYLLVTFLGFSFAFWLAVNGPSQDREEIFISCGIAPFTIVLFGFISDCSKRDANIVNYAVTNQRFMYPYDFYKIKDIVIREDIADRSFSLRLRFKSWDSKPEWDDGASHVVWWRINEDSADIVEAIKKVCEIPIFFDCFPEKLETARVASSVDRT